jgi:hypothetical protein
MKSFRNVECRSSQIKPYARVACHHGIKADTIHDVTGRGEAVLDTFMDCGSKLVAAEGRGHVDLDPLYVGVAVRRWQARTRRDAVHAETAELRKRRVGRLVAPQGEEPHGQQR